MKEELYPSIIHTYIDELRKKYEFKPEEFIMYSIECMFKDGTESFTVKNINEITKLVSKLEKEY